LVANLNNKIVASADLQLIDAANAKTGRIGIIVKKEFRGLGIGKQILITLREYAALLGVKTLSLTVFATNSKAIKLYEKVGFVEVERVPNKYYRKGNYVDGIVMVRNVE
jgi:RimJ/RimL family protein N-acetyltransferase